MRILKQEVTLSTVAIYVAILVFFLIFISANYRFFYAEMNKGLYVRLNLFSIVLIVFSTILLFLKNKARINALIIAFLLILSVYTVEVFLSFSYINPIKFQNKERVSNYDYRDDYEIINEFAKNSIEVVPAIPPASFLDMGGVVGKGSFFSAIPLSGISDKKTILCNRNKQHIVYDSDRYGFNNKDSAWDTNKSKWVLVGDAFTHGSCVNTESDIASRLGVKEGRAVINLSYGGNGPLLDLAALTEYATIVRPEKVFWIYHESNDLTILKEELKNSILVQYMHSGFSQDLINKQKKIDQSLLSHLTLEELINKNRELGKGQIKLADDDYMKRALKLYNLQEKLGLISHQSSTPEEFQDVIKRANQIVSSWGGELYFVYLPMYLRYSSQIESHDMYNHKKQVLDMVQSSNVSIIDIHNRVFEEHENSLGLFSHEDNSYYTSEGYRLVSQAISNFVKDN